MSPPHQVRRLSVSIPRGCGKEGENPLSVVSPAFILERIWTSSSGTRRMHCQIKPGRPRINVLFANGHWKRTVCSSDIWQELNWTGRFVRETLCCGVEAYYQSTPASHSAKLCMSVPLARWKYASWHAFGIFLMGQTANGWREAYVCE